jgi:hypothetical protein
VTDGNASGATNVTSDSLNIAANGGSIDLDTAINTLDTVTAGGTVSIRDVDGFAVKSVSAPGQTVNLAAGGAGAITDGNGGTNNITANILNATAATGIDLDTTVNTLVATNSVSGDINISDADGIDLGGVTSAGNFILTTVLASSTITQTGALNITGTTTLTPGSSGNVVLNLAVLGQPVNVFGGTVSVTTGNTVNISGLNGIDLGPISIGGDLTVTAGTGNITNTGGAGASDASLTIGGNANFTANDPAGASITLDDQDNTFAGSIDIQGVNLNNVTVVDTDVGGLTLRNLTISGNLILSSGGAIGQIPGLIGPDQHRRNDDPHSGCDQRCDPSPEYQRLRRRRHRDARQERDPARRQ